MAPALNVQALIERATSKTGLADLGDPPWREGLEVLVEALEREAQLSDVGRLAFARRLTHLLECRMGIVDWQRRYPEMFLQRITRPAIIIGLPRTGTSALSNLLLQDPATRSLRYWEAADPTPPPEAATYHTDPRIAERQRKIDALHQQLPALKMVHAAAATSAAEGGEVLMMAFASLHFPSFAAVPSYERWLLAQDMVGPYAFQRGFLQLLQWRCPPTRWHLKNPADMFFLGAVRAVFPDAVFIWTHRDPAHVLASTCSLYALSRGIAGDPVDRLSLGAEHIERWSECVARAMAYRDAHRDIFYDLKMRDLVADPIGTVARVYGWLGWPFTAEAEAAMVKWAAENPQGVHGRHEPNPADFGLNLDAVRERFAEYLERFDLVDARGAKAK